MYDNFDYREGVKHQLISNHAQMRSVTTGKVIRGADIPPGGLKRSMLHREVPLTKEDLLFAPGAAEYDEVAAKIDTYFITEAIRAVYPESVNHIFRKSDISYPSMPAIELLEPRKTDNGVLLLFDGVSRRYSGSKGQNGGWVTGSTLSGSALIRSFLYQRIGLR